MSGTRFEIERLSITLQGVPAAEASRIADELEPALMARLAAMPPVSAPAQLGQADLGAIAATPGMSSRALADAIAGRLVDWIGRQTASSGRGET